MMQQSSPSSPDAQGVDHRLKRRLRKPLSCEACRFSKLRCDRQLPCATCLRRGLQDSCEYGTNRADCARLTPRRKTQPTAARSVSHPQQHRPTKPSELVTPQSQSPEPIHHRWDTILCRPPIEKNQRVISKEVVPTLAFGPTIPIPSLLGMLPPDVVCEYLVSHYFAFVFPLFHVLHGPTFQKQYSDFLQNPQQVDLSWLALLFAILSLTLKTIEPKDPGLVELWQTPSSPQDLAPFLRQYRNAAMICLSQDQFLVRHNLNTLEALLILIHTISDSEGAEYGWTLLGNALNMGIAMRCHADSSEPNCIQRERRRRCWAGILILHTSQALLFRDVDLSFLCNMKSTMVADANDDDIREDGILTPINQVAPTRPTQMSLMRFQTHLFQLSTQICNHVSGPDRLDEVSLNRFDSAVAAAQQQWDSLYLVNGARSILDTAGYAHWCILQTYAHQLYLLLHRPFHNSRSSQFRPASRARCVESSVALMDIHRQLYELPRLKSYRWIINGTVTCNALHGAVALTSCLLDVPNGPDFSEHLSVIDATVYRLEKLRGNSPACESVYYIIRRLQCHLSRPDSAPSPRRENAETSFDDWVSSVDWFRPDEINWDFWVGDYTSPQSDDRQNLTV